MVIFENMTTPSTSLLESLKHLNAQQLRRLLVEHLTQQKVGLYWESSAIARDAALNADVVLPRLRPDISHTLPGTAHHGNLIIEGDNFDSHPTRDAVTVVESCRQITFNQTTPPKKGRRYVHCHPLRKRQFFARAG